MSRPFCPRRIARVPHVTFFKPAGVALRGLNVTLLALDEFESLRLADGEGLEHSQAAAKMGVSRQTFTRIVRRARKKVADFLSQGCALSIEGAAIREYALPKKKCSEGK